MRLKKLKGEQTARKKTEKENRVKLASLPPSSLKVTEEFKKSKKSALLRVTPPQKSLESDLTSTLSSDGYVSLNGSQIQKLFKNLDYVRFPLRDGRAAWELSFKEKGSWKSSRGRLSAWGKWHVKDDALCIVVGGVDTNPFLMPYEGCFRVGVNFTTDTITAFAFDPDLIPALGNDRFLLKENAIDNVAQLKIPAQPNR